MDKLAKKKITPGPPEKQYYSVKVEALMPVTLIYNITATTPEDAIKMVSKSITQRQAGPPKINYAKFSKGKAIVYKRWSSLIVLTSKI